MGRSVDYLRGARSVSYFNWPSYECEDGEQHYEDAEWVIDDIRESIKSEFPEFSNASGWPMCSNVNIILNGYGTEIALGEYCGLCSLSIRVLTDEVEGEDIARVEKWIDANWDNISSGYNMYRKVGTFSNGEAIFETK